jgi:hypothetical protein
MPLLKGKSKKVLAENFHELRHGKTFTKTSRKFGKPRARKQMVAIALKQSRKRG